MADIDDISVAAREQARARNGKFGEQNHTDPEAQVAGPKTYPVFAQVHANTNPPVPYPDDIPEGGVVTANLEDNGGAYVTITFPVEVSTDDDEVTVSVGGSNDRRDQWDSLENEETGFDDNTNEAILRYLREVQTHVDHSVGSAQWAASEPLMQTFANAATGVTIPEPEDAEVAYHARAVKRGEQLAHAFADEGDEVETVAADAIADILLYARSKGIFLGDVLDRARGYADDAMAQLNTSHASD